MVKPGATIKLALKKRYTLEEVNTAQCVWEWVLDVMRPTATADDYVTREIKRLHRHYGASAMRDASVVVALVAQQAANYAEVHGIIDMDMVIFDWEFVPAVCRNVSWQQIIHCLHMKLSYAAAVDIRRVVANIVAKQALDLEK